MFTLAQLEAYLDEALPPADMAAVEAAARSDTALREQLAAINARRDTGVHSVAEIWRRGRLSCPSRERWGSYLLEAISAEESRAMTIHLEVVGCRACLANVDDLRRQQAEVPDAAQSRRRKFFQSSAGYLRRT